MTAAEARFPNPDTAPGPGFCAQACIWAKVSHLSLRSAASVFLKLCGFEYGKPARSNCHAQVLALDRSET
jgi:hypothetical protein